MNVTNNISEEEKAGFGRAYSPIIMAHDWPKMGRLMFLVFFSTMGTIMNGFFISSFFVEKSLRKAGNIFLACVGVCDFAITSIVMPTAAVVLLSGQWDLVEVCGALHFITESSTLSISLFYMLVAAENYYRICRTHNEYSMFVTSNITIVSILVFVVCILISGVGVFMHLDYDYCLRAHHGNFYFRSSTSIIFNGISFILTACCLLIASLQVKRRASRQIQYKRSHQYDRDYSTTSLNITAYATYVGCWIPYLIIVHEYPDTSDANFYHSVWFGMSRSVFTSMIYACFNRNFRRAFAHLFNYCCCKSTLSSSFNGRHRRTLECIRTADFKVHILQSNMSFTSTGCFGFSFRETHDL